MTYFIGLLIIAVAGLSVWKSVSMLYAGSFTTDSVILYILTIVFVAILYESRKRDSKNGKDNSKGPGLPKS